MGKNYTYGYKDSHSQMKIPKFSPTWQAWRAGKTKPKPYFDGGWFWEIKIEYFDILEDLENKNVSVFRQLFGYNKREYASNTREFMETKLLLNGKTIKTSTIRLVRLSLYVERAI